MLTDKEIEYMRKWYIEDRNVMRLLDAYLGLQDDLSKLVEAFEAVQSNFDGMDNQVLRTLADKWRKG